MKYERTAQLPSDLPLHSISPLVLDTRPLGYLSWQILFAVGLITAWLMSELPRTWLISIFLLYAAAYYAVQAAVRKSGIYLFSVVCLFSFAISRFVFDTFFHGKQMGSSLTAMTMLVSVLFAFVLTKKQQRSYDRHAPMPEEVALRGLVWRFRRFGTFQFPYSATLVVLLIAAVCLYVARQIANMEYFNIYGIFAVIYLCLLYCAVGYRRKLFRQLEAHERDGGEWFCVTAGGIAWQYAIASWWDDMTHSSLVRGETAWKNVTKIAIEWRGKRRRPMLYVDIALDDGCQVSFAFSDEGYSDFYWKKLLCSLKQNALRQ